MSAHFGNFSRNPKSLRIPSRRFALQSASTFSFASRLARTCFVSSQIFTPLLNSQISLAQPSVELWLRGVPAASRHQYMVTLEDVPAIDRHDASTQRKAKSVGFIDMKFQPHKTRCT
jgi:hypothetical protein